MELLKTTINEVEVDFILNNFFLSFSLLLTMVKNATSILNKNKSS